MVGGIDFELEIAGGEGGYQVSASSSAGGEVSAAMRFPFDEPALRERLLQVELALAKSSTRARGRVLSEDEARVQGFGRALFDALFAGDVRSLFDSARSRAAQADERVRLLLRIRAPELARLPWELLYDPRRDDYLALSASLVRYAEVMEPPKPLTVAPPLRILGMVASPAAAATLDAVQEQRRVSGALVRLEREGRVGLDWAAGQTWSDLQAALQGQPWHVVHFIGHGRFDRRAGEGSVAFADEQGLAAWLGAAKLGQLLRTCPSLRLVVLNTCDSGRASAGDVFSSTAAVLTRTGIPAVAAMQFEISDQAAIRFAAAFYQALAVGLPVDEATVAGRLAINMARDDTLEWATPVLYLRSSDARLFDVADAAPGGVHPGRPATAPTAKRPLRRFIGGAAAVAALIGLAAAAFVDGARTRPPPAPVEGGQATETDASDPAEGSAPGTVSAVPSPDPAPLFDDFGADQIDPAKWQNLGSAQQIYAARGRLHFDVHPGVAPGGVSTEITARPSAPIGEITYTVSLTSFTGASSGGVDMIVEHRSGRDHGVGIGPSTSGRAGFEYSICRQQSCDGQYASYDHPSLSIRENQPLRIRIAWTGETTQFFVDDVLQAEGPVDHSPITAFKFFLLAAAEDTFHVEVDDVRLAYAGE